MWSLNTGGAGWCMAISSFGLRHPPALRPAICLQEVGCSEQQWLAMQHYTRERGYHGSVLVRNSQVKLLKVGPVLLQITSLTNLVMNTRGEEANFTSSRLVNGCFPTTTSLLWKITKLSRLRFSMKNGRQSNGLVNGFGLETSTVEALCKGDMVPFGKVRPGANALNALVM